MLQSSKLTYWSRPMISFTNKDIADNIIRIICDGYALDYPTLASTDRSNNLVEARQLCMWYIKKQTTYSLNKIGLLMGGRHHATVIYGIAHIDDLLTYDKKIQEKMHKLDVIIENSHYTFTSL